MVDVCGEGSGGVGGGGCFVVREVFCEIILLVAEEQNGS